MARYKNGDKVLFQLLPSSNRIKSSWFDENNKIDPGLIKHGSLRLHKNCEFGTVVDYTLSNDGEKVIVSYVDDYRDTVQLGFNECDLTPYIDKTKNGFTKQEFLDGKIAIRCTSETRDDLCHFINVECFPHRAPINGNPTDYYYSNQTEDDWFCTSYPDKNQFRLCKITDLIKEGTITINNLKTPKNEFTKQEFLDGKIAILRTENQTKELMSLIEDCGFTDRFIGSIGEYYYVSTQDKDCRITNSPKTKHRVCMMSGLIKEGTITINNLKTPKNEYGKSIKVCAVTPNVTNGKRPKGKSVSGKSSRTAIAVRPLRNKAIVG